MSEKAAEVVGGIVAIVVGIPILLFMLYVLVAVIHAFWDIT